MATALLETKFHLPVGRRPGVARPRLADRLDGAWQSALTLVCAPAGFGKTTVLAQWLAAARAAGRAGAWLSLDVRDNDPAVFWTYLVTALSRADHGLGAEALALLRSPRPAIDGVLASLVNDLGATSNDIVLVLDDYHLLDVAEVHEGMTFVLEHCPAQLHLVMAGRADPPLPLARLRSRGELVELRAADLRFTSDEAAAYLNSGMGLTLTAPDVQMLEERTEGWIAALQLAALSMQGRRDVSAFIAGFAGDDRYIVDYLAEEVLDRQPAAVRRFLLETSVLERLSGPLCDAVTGQSGSSAMLAMLERGNMFLVPLDDRRRWFRYHQLFADVLQARLRDEQPDALRILHERASGWYERAGDIPQAIDHALAAEAFDRSADLIERGIPQFSRLRQEKMVREWLEVIPAEVIGVRPVLIVGFAGAVLSGGRLDGVEARLREAERFLDGSPAGAPGPPVAARPMVVADQEQFQHLPTMIALYRAALALALGDLPATVQHARRAISLSPENHLGRASGAGLLGLALWTGGDLEAGHRAYAQCSAGLLRAGHVADSLGCAIALADIRVSQGRLTDAVRTLRQAMQRAEDAETALPGMADMHVALSAHSFERGDLVTARAHLTRSEELGANAELPQNRYRWRVAMARLADAEGDREKALDLLDEAERCYVPDFFPNVRPIPALRARMWIAQGNLTDAAGWARENGLTAQDDLSFLREYEHLTLGRLLLASSSADRADDTLEVTEFLERLLGAARDGGRTGSVLEVLVLQALWHSIHGDSARAMDALQQALSLAEPEGYRRIFTEQGPSMATLLRAVPAQAPTRQYAQRLLAADPGIVDRTAAGPRATAVGAASARASAVIEPLSERELDVLRLLATDLSGPDIARRLFISVNTVRTHTSNVYRKLGVTSRRAAVRAAAELDLITHPDQR